MTIDITPRQHGKTFRLINAAVKYLKASEKNIVTIISKKEAQSRHIRKAIIQLAFVKKDRVATSITMGKAFKKGNKCFVDEFDFIDSDKLKITRNAYYCTSMKSELGSKFTRELLSIHYKSCDPISAERYEELAKILK
jgi:hypothetical protein